MVAIVVSYRMLSVFNFYEPGMSWKELVLMFILTCLIGAILLALSNIIIKFYPSLIKKGSILGMHYNELYNERYIKKPYLFDKLTQVSVWKVLAFILVVMYVLIQYYTLAFTGV